MKKHKATYPVILLFSLAFVLFAVFYYDYDRRQAQVQIEEHGRIIADALWNYNETGAAEYLSLAARSHNYEHLVVKDTSGRVFLKVEKNETGWIDRILTKAGLIPRIALHSDIIFRDTPIGRIEAVWRCRAIYTLAYVLWATALFVAIILLYLRLLQGKQSLEDRVRERTDELAMSNQSLQLEVTERKRAEEALRESREVLRATFESMNDGVLVVSGNGSIIQSNTRFSEIWSIPENVLESADDLTLIDYVMPQLASPEEFGFRVKQIYQTSRTSDDLLHFKNGCVIERISAPLWQEGREAGRVWVFRDITDRTRAEEEKASLQDQLQQAQKMDAIGTLSSGIAHDFNNIMQVISGYLQLLQLRGRWEAATPQYLGEMSAAIEKASNLVQGLLTFGRKVEPKLEPLDLNHAILEMLKIIERTIPKMIEIETSLTEDLRMIDADPNQLQRIILNLTTNARDAMPDGGKLSIVTENITLHRHNGGPHPGLPAGPWVRLRFSDTGQGMDEETVQRIFEPFFTTKEVGKGTGLGLPVTYGIVKTHGGHIFCHSGPDQGTRFDIYFPASRLSPSKTGQPAETNPEKVSGGQETILFVDDEKSILHIATEVLTRNGYTVLTADSGEKAIELYRQNQHRIQLVVLDLGMPGMGGAVCLQKLLTIEPDLTVLVASGYAAEGLVQQTLEQGAAGFIPKPYLINQMLQQIRSALDTGPPDQNREALE